VPALHLRRLVLKQLADNAAPTLAMASLMVSRIATSSKTMVPASTASYTQLSAAAFKNFWR
jgi:hypothetical protein